MGRFEQVVVASPEAVVVVVQRGPIGTEERVLLAALSFMKIDVSAHDGSGCVARSA